MNHVHRRERKREQSDEVALAIRTERVTPEPISDVLDLDIETCDRRRPERILQDAPLPAVVRIVGGPEDPTLLLVDTDTEAVAPLGRAHQQVEDVGVSARHVERWVVGDLGVQRTAGA